MHKQNFIILSAIVILSIAFFFYLLSFGDFGFSEDIIEFPVQSHETRSKDSISSEATGSLSVEDNITDGS